MFLSPTSALLGTNGENHTTAWIDFNSSLWLPHLLGTHKCLANFLCFSRQPSLPVSNWQFQMFSLSSHLPLHLLICHSQHQASPIQREREREKALNCTLFPGRCWPHLCLGPQLCLLQRTCSHTHALPFLLL